MQDDNMQDTYLDINLTITSYQRFPDRKTHLRCFENEEISLRKSGVWWDFALVRYANANFAQLIDPTDTISSDTVTLEYRDRLERVHHEHVFLKPWGEFDQAMQLGLKNLLNHIRNDKLYGCTFTPCLTFLYDKAEPRHAYRMSNVVLFPPQHYTA